MIAITRTETYSWDAAQDISREEAILFMNALRQQLTIKSTLITDMMDLPFHVSPSMQFGNYDTAEQKLTVAQKAQGWRLPLIEEITMLYNCNDNRFLADSTVYWAGNLNSRGDAWVYDIGSCEPYEEDRTNNSYFFYICDK